MIHQVVPDESSFATDCAAKPTITKSPGAEPWRAAQRISLWLLLSAAGAIGVAWVAIQAQNHGFAPIGLTAIAIGVVVADISRRAASSTGAEGARKRLIVALLAALLAVVAQDYIGFWEHVHERSRFQSANPKAAVFAAEDDSAGPAAFAAFLKSRILKSPALWGFDAALTLVAAMVWTVAYSRHATQKQPATAALNSNSNP